MYASTLTAHSNIFNLVSMLKTNNFNEFILNNLIERELR